MPVILAAAGKMAIGAGTSVLMGYAIEKTVGDGHYSRRDFVTDAVVGAVGIGQPKHIAKGAYVGYRYGRKAAKARKAGKATVPVTRMGVEVAQLTVDEAHLLSKAAYGSSAYHGAVLFGSESFKGYSGRISSFMYREDHGVRDPTESPKKKRRLTQSKKKELYRLGLTWCPIHKKYDRCK